MLLLLLLRQHKLLVPWSKLLLRQRWRLQGRLLQ
jgi:hypothetical protein